MDETEALELLDAHLDGQTITPDQTQALAIWLRDHPDHADRAFRRIFLHTFLRQRLQHSSQPVDLSVMSLDDSNSNSIIQPAEPLALSDSSSFHDKRRARFLGRVVTFCSILCLLIAAVGLAAQALIWPRNTIVGLWVYEGFDYPPTVPAPPLGDGNKWPTSGGLEGLAGGFGWSEPWHESAQKVSVLVADMQANAWRSSDMRKFGPLGYTDSQGHALNLTGIQLRSAAGPLSTTARSLDVSTFPPSIIEDQMLGRDGSVVWLSFLAQSFDGRGLGSFAFVQLGTDSAGFRLGKLASVPSGNWAASGIRDGAELNTRWSDIPSGQAVFVVVRIRFRQGDEEADVWMNPALGGEPSQTAAFRVPLPDFRFHQLSISSRYTTDFDEIRIGGSFYDVTPTR